MTYNIEDGPAERLELLGHVIGSMRPDIIAVQEILDLDNGLALASALQMAPVLAEPIVERANSDPPFDTLWIGTFSKLPVQSVQVHRGRPGILHRPALEVTYECPDGTAVTVVNVHLISRLVAEEAARKWREADELREILRSVRRRHCVLGDFNAWVPGEGDLSPEWQPEYPQLYRDAVRGGVLGVVLEGGYMDAFRSVHRGDIALPQSLRDRAGSRVDHILLDPELAGSLGDCRIMDSGVDVRAASDHFPVIADFTL
jgi:endonuclease/exonuclease/phosphatase family metal-dependent hydrolase